MRRYCEALRHIVSSDSVISLPQFLQSSSSPPPLPQIRLSLNKEEEEEEEDCFKPSLCCPPSISYSVGGGEIRWAGAGGPGWCPDPGRSSSGLHQSLAGQPRGTASCRQSRSPETKLHAAPTRSQRLAYPVRRGEPVKLNLTMTVFLFKDNNQDKKSASIDLSSVFFCKYVYHVYRKV